MLFRLISILVLVLFRTKNPIECASYSSFSNSDAIFNLQENIVQPRNQPASLCYDCADSNTQECTAKTPNCPMCMIIRNAKNSTLLNRRCCWSDCGPAFQVREKDSITTYFCTGDLCNGPTSDSIFGPSGVTMTSTSSITTTTTVTTRATTTMVSSTTGPSACFDCADTSTAPCTSITQNCPMCMVSRNERNPDLFDRRCCWWNCGPAFQVSQFNGRPTYFCSGNQCNKPGSEAALGGPVMTTTTTSSTTTIATTTTTTKAPMPSACFDCAHSGGMACTSITNNCPMCMVYRNEQNPNVFERQCCWWNCGPAFQVSQFNGRPTYFCSGDQCNKPGSEAALGGPAMTTTTTTTRPTTTIATTTTTNKAPTPSACFDCAHSGGMECTSITNNCPMCMVYQNEQNPNAFERRCCWSNCGPAFQVSQFNGRPTYFCSGNQCNKPGSEAALGGPVITTTTTTAMTTRPTATTTTRPTTAITTTIATTTTKAPGPSICYDCSGSQCGTNNLNLVQNCPTCMIYRNPSNPDNIERRCCWWNCGQSNTIGVHNGQEAYFCNGDSCNGIASDKFLSPAPTKPSTTTVVTTTSVGCRLNCQNGGIPETKNGCFCHCPENTSGLECENIVCGNSDEDQDLCSLENEPLCAESELFAWTCVNLCGKC